MLVRHVEQINGIILTTVDYTGLITFMNTIRRSIYKYEEFVQKFSSKYVNNASVNKQRITHYTTLLDVQ